MTRTLLVLLCLAASALAEPRLDQHGDPLPDGAIHRFGTMRHRIGSAISVRAWALSPDGKMLAVEDRLGITVWDVETGRPAKRFSVAGTPDETLESALHYSPDGKSIARLAGRVVSVLDATTGKERFSSDPKKLGQMRQLSFVTGPDRLVATHEDLGKAFYLDPTTGRTLSTVETEAPIWNLLPSGRYFLGWSQGVPMVPLLVDAKTGKVRARFPDAQGATVHSDFMLSPDDRRLYLGRDNGRLQTFDAETGKLLEDLARPLGLKELDHGVRWSLSPDASIAYQSLRGSVIRRRDLKAGNRLEPLPRSFGGPILTLPDGKHVLQVGEDGVLRRYDLATLKQLPQTEGFEGQLFASAAPDGRHIVVMSEDSSGTRMDLYDTAGKSKWSIRADEWTTPGWSPDSRTLICVAKHTIVLRDAATNFAVRTIKAAAKGEEFSHAFVTPGGYGLVAILDPGQAVAVYDPKTGNRRSFTETKVRATVTMAPDGRTLVFDSDERGLALFDVEGQQFRKSWVEKRVEGDRDWLGRNEISPDASYLLTWDVVTKMPAMVDTAVAVLREPETLEKKHSFEVELNGPYEFAFSPDGQWLAVGDQNGTLRLWDVVRGEKIAEWKGHRDRINAVRFVGLGRVLTSSDDLTALLWDLRPKEKPAKPQWDALSGKDAREAYLAVWAIADDPKGPELLRSKVVPAKPAAAEQVKQWLADLGADKFAVRETATRELSAIGRLIVPELRAAREKTTSEEVRTRIDALIAKVPRERSGSEIVHARAVAAMELSGSEAAKKLLAEWAKGAPGARLTIDAKAALVRPR